VSPEGQPSREKPVARKRGSRGRVPRPAAALPSRATHVEAAPHLAVHIDAARDAERKGNHEEARRHYEAALRALRDEEDARVAPALLRWTGTNHRAEGNGGAALDCYGASLVVARRLRNRRDVAHALNWIGIIYQDRGRLDAADRVFHAARHTAWRARDRHIVAMVEQNLGINCNIRGKLDEALVHYRRALVCYERLGERRYTAQVLNVLGMLYTDRKQWAAAERAFERAANLCAELGEAHTRVMVEVNRAELCVTRGQLERARAACDRALALAEPLRQLPALAEVYRWYGAIFREAGQPAESEKYLHLAFDIARSHDIPLLAAEAQRELASLFRAQERNREALQALLDSRRIFKELQARRDLAELGQRLAELESQFVSVVAAWAESIEAKDRYTHGHCARVTEYGTALARRLGFDEDAIHWFRMGAYLHDVGKIETPVEILNKPGRLTTEEFEIMKRHTTAGDAIVAELNFPWDIRPIVRSHHEAWDGSGYPDGLAGEAIPIAARILCVADVFDALSSTRPYRPALSLAEALGIMERSSGTQLDPDIFNVFCELIGENAFPSLVAAA
jgi:putative nucleotidyltransferase with HDIG domain